MNTTNFLKFCTCMAILAMSLPACIGDDFIADTVEESVRIDAQIDSLGIGDSYQFQAVYTNNIGMMEDREILWTTRDPDILSIDMSGLATGVSEGEATVTARVVLPEKTVLAERVVFVTDTTVISGPTIRSGSLRTTSSYTLRGEFELEEVGDNLVLSLDESYKASSNLPGLYVYLTNNPNSTNGAYEIGAVEVFDGAHSFTFPRSEAGINDYSHVLYFCKPFNVKVGDGQFDE